LNATNGELKFRLGMLEAKLVENKNRLVECNAALKNCRDICKPHADIIDSLREGLSKEVITFY
jgi:hypothetical protein